MSTEQQPPPITLQWFRPQPDADGQYSFPPRVQYLAAAWCEPGDCWVYVAGFFEPDGGDEWVLEGRVGRIELADIDWLARLDCGKPDGQKTLFENGEGGQ